MAGPFVTELPGRGVIHVGGEDAVHFLHNLVTANVEGLAEGAGAYGALLTPQGKIVSDFLIARTADGVLLDVPAGRVEDLVKRLAVYKLRAKVTVADVSERTAVIAFWQIAAPPTLPGPVFPDPRSPALGLRAIVPRELARGNFNLSHVTRTDPSAWHRLRIAHAIPESERDFALGETFPHDADMDQLNGVDFRKGCYVGQEVVSRMQHRGTARRRIVKVTGGSDLPAEGTPIEAAGRSVGTLGSAAGAEGLALVRLDRAAEAMAAGTPITAGSVTVSLAVPDWARFSFPAVGAGEAPA